MRFAAIATCGFAVLLGANTALGAGFQINEHSAKATGRAASVVATIDDAAAVFYNPAGLTNTKGTTFQAGLTLIRPTGGYTGLGYPSTNAGFAAGTNQDADTTNPFVPVPNVYISRALSPKAFVGFGFYLPYGLGLEWKDKDQFAGRTVVKEISLRTFFLTPAIALKLSDAVSVAVGVSLVPATVYLDRTIGASDNGQVLFPASLYSKEGTVEIAGSAFGVGANAGVQVTLIEHLKLGLAFRSAVDLAFSGTANFTVPEELPAEIKASFPDQDVDADATLPHSFDFGIGWVQGPLTIELSSMLTLWTSYDEFRINFSTGKPSPTSASPKNWKTVPRFRLGGQYMVTPELAVRAGVALDFSPIPDETIDPTLPGGNRIQFGAGAGYDFGPVWVDLAYLGISLSGREITAESNNTNFAPGEYQSGIIHLISTTVGVKI